MGTYQLFLALIFAQALNACASATFAFVNPLLFALGNKPAASAKVLHHAAIHHFFVKATQEAVEGFAFTEFHRHINHPLLV